MRKALTAAGSASRIWSGEMFRRITKSIEYWNRINEWKAEHDLSESMKLIAEYDRIVEKARKEYEYEPPSRCYRDGRNTYKLMYEERERYVLFFLDLSSPLSNNLAERSGRRYKRKNLQVMALGSEKGSGYYCDGLSVLGSMKAKKNLYKGIAARFNR